LETQIVDIQGGSRNTLTAYVSSVKAFTEYLEHDSPEKLLESFQDRDDRENTGRKWVLWLVREKGNSPNTIIQKLTGLKKWLRLNDVDVDWDKIDKPRTVYITKDRTPTSEELKALTDTSPLPGLTKSSRATPMS
jgi:hypothetical protein